MARAAALLAVVAALALSGASPAAQSNPCPTGCMNFAVNVHDTGHINDSAATILHLIDIFERHHVKGEFYFTGSMIEMYVAQRPDVIKRLKQSKMTISYHVRAPHPLVEGFDQKLDGLSGAEHEAVLRDYETYALDRATGGLNRSKPGGYTLLQQTFGSNPITVVAPNAQQKTRLAALRVYKSMGAGMVVWYHEEGAKIETPLEVREGLLVRPSDFSITRWGPRQTFWWNRPFDSAFDPVAYLQKRLKEWRAPRAAFVTALIHENNFYRFGPESWTFAYYSNGDKTTPLPPPWTLTPREASRVLSGKEQAAIWAHYEALVKWSAAHLNVVTGTELIPMAAARR